MLGRGKAKEKKTSQTAAKEPKKESKKEWKKRTLRKYGQARLKHSRMGKYSCYLALSSFLVLTVSVLTAFFMRGKTVGFLGGLGILAVVLAGLGIRAGVKGRREREKSYVTCWIGIAGNLVILTGLVMIFFGGLV